MTLPKKGTLSIQDSQDLSLLTLHLMIGEPMKKIIINPERSYRTVQYDVHESMQ